MSDVLTMEVVYAEQDLPEEIADLIFGEFTTLITDNIGKSASSAVLLDQEIAGL